MRKKTALMIATILTLLMVCWGCGSTPSAATADIVYLKSNIHYQQGTRDSKASYANWTNPGSGHRILPVNTAVSIGRFRRGFSITNQENGATVLFEYHEPNMNMTKEEYLDLITSPTKVSLSGLSEIDRKGIQEGKVYPGMSKDGVRMALGYPAAHKTPSLKSDIWIYWTNRFRSFAVEFDSQGKVK